MPRRRRRYLENLFERAAAFGERYNAISTAMSDSPQPESAAVADFGTPLGAHVADNATAFLAVATDYISAWRRLFVDSRYQPLYAHGGLVRGAFESALMARYLLDPSLDQEERVGRALGLSIDDFVERTKYEKSRTSLNLPPDDQAPFHRKELERDIRTHGLHPKSRPGLEWLAEQYADGSWIINAMSALAHGRGWAHALSERHDEIPLGGNRYRAWFTADDVLSYQLTNHALVATGRALGEAELYVGIGTGESVWETTPPT